MADINEMLAKRARLVGEARALLDLAETENRTPTAEENESYEKMLGSIDEMNKSIKREEDLRALEKAAALGAPPVIPEGTAGGEDHSDNPRASEQYRKSFWSVMRSRNPQAEEVRDLYSADDVQGGYLVPESYERSLISAANQINVMRQLADVKTSATLNRIPVDATAPTFAYIDEKGSYPETDATFGQKVLDAYKAGGYIKVSEELLQDSMFDLEGYIREKFGLAAGNLEEASFISGTGVGKPTGLLVDSVKGVDAASATAITFEETMDLIFSVKEAYRARSSFLMNEATVLALMKIKATSDGQFLWQPSVQAGQPDRLRGYAVRTSPEMPLMAANNKSVAFGDFKNYRIQDRLGISIQVLRELFALTGQVGFKCTYRHDGKLLLPEAVKHIKQHA